MDEPSKKRISGKTAKAKGHNGERVILKELKELTGDEELTTTRLSSRAWDNAGIDIYDPNDTLPFYVQVKVTQSNPSYHDLIPGCKMKKKPLVVFHKKQIKKTAKCVSGGEYVIMDKQLFYDLIKSRYGAKDE